MSRGHTDYNRGDYTLALQDASIDDLIASMRGFGSINQRGRVLIYTDFRNGTAGWTGNTAGTGQVPLLDFSPESLSLFPANIKFPILANGDKSEMYHDTRFPLYGKIGIEAGIRLNHTSGATYLTGTYNGEGYGTQKFGVRFDSTTEQVQLYRQAGWEDSGIVIIHPVLDTGWLQFKIVYNITTHVYQNFDWGCRSIGLAGAGYAAGAEDEYQGFVRLLIGVEALDAVHKDPMWCSYVIATYDEP